jgi:hypothetical protein
MTKLLACVVLSVVSLVACSSSSSQVDIATTPLSGTVDGMPWTFQVGATNAFLSEGQTDFFGTFHASSYMVCVESGSTELSLIASVPRQPGDYDFNLDRNITVVGADNFNRVATEGRIVIDSVTATTVTGGLHATFDKSNEVNGRFQITICPK